MIVQLILFFFLLFVFLTQGMAAGFDCGKATTNIEKLICSNQLVSRRDEILNEYYKILVNSVRNPNLDRKEQRQWIREIRNKCDNADCLNRVYAARAIELIDKIRVKTGKCVGQKYLKKGSIVERSLLSQKIADVYGEKLYGIFEVDFNNDSSNELIAKLMCGNGGCRNLVFKKIDERSLEFITAVSFHEKGFQLIANNSNLSDILHYSRSSASEGCLITEKFNGCEYLETNRQCGTSNLFHEIKVSKIKQIDVN